MKLPFSLLNGSLPREVQKRMLWEDAKEAACARFKTDNPTSVPDRIEFKPGMALPQDYEELMAICRLIYARGYWECAIRTDKERKAWEKTH